MAGPCTPDTVVYLHAEGDDGGEGDINGRDVTTWGGGLQVTGSRVRGGAAARAAEAAAVRPGRYYPPRHLSRFKPSSHE